MQIILSFHWSRVHHVTCKSLRNNYDLLLRNVVYLYATQSASRVV